MSYINSLKETHINTCNNTCINISINKNNTIKECTECKHPCNIEKKEGCVCKFNILTLIDIPKEVTYSKEENEKFLCLNCKIYNILNCTICGYLFNIKSIFTKKSSRSQSKPPSILKMDKFYCPKY